MKPLYAAFERLVAAAAAFTCDRCESLLGFTSTRYGLRPIAEVEAEIDAYYS